ncbi:DNA methyltransferase [Morganella morganii]|uniref:DNA methyltransferase n=1 Tax=Morganella morganii TaxID=582 RepID=UPI003EBBE9B5
MQTELIKELNKVLKAFPQFWNGEELHRSMVSDAISQKQPEIIKALVANEKIRSVYGSDIDGILIFDFDKLCSLLKYKEYWANSFTKYRNKVGLTSNGKYLDYNSDVVLDFPFKDCVLEGGMTKEDKGKDEVYYNGIIAKDEIDNLFSPKTLINIKRYKQSSIDTNIKNISIDENLIIKGNNLIALHSLNKRYAEKVKLIYIDPPYNTGKDSFKYNDSFNRSSWLTFMKNRLEVAKDLLSDDGVIFVHIDNNEQAYLKVLMDSIFKEDNFMATLIWENKEGGGKSDSKHFRIKHEYIICYAKQLEKASISGVDIDNESRYSLADSHEKERGKYYLQKLGMGSIQYSESLDYPITMPDNTKIYPRDNNNGKKAAWRWSKEKLLWGIANDFIVMKKDSKDIWTVYTKQYLRADNNGSIIERKQQPIGVINKYSTTQGSKHIREMFGDSVFNYSKPEGVLYWILNVASKEGDLVLDFHLGSGTTAAVAHKMGRRYIGIEQMDYINEITVPRLQKVIEGEQGGISKDVNWQGGGSFVYAELMELNAYFVHEIQKAQSTEELEKLFTVMKTEAHLNYQVALENVLSAEYEVDGIFRKVAFSELELHEQKQLLIEILDKNQLYVNASDMDDSDLNISESDKAFTRSFYGME